MKLQGNYNLEEMVNHLLKEKKEFRLQQKHDATIIVFKSLGKLNPVMREYWLYFDSNGKQLHFTAPVASI